MQIMREKVGPLNDKGGNLCLEVEDVGEILNEYFVLVFTQEKDTEDSEISVEHVNMLGYFAIKKEVVLHPLKSIEVAKSPRPDGIYPSQGGFVPGRSCLTNLIEFFEEVTKMIDDSRAVDVVYMDFSKAFDKVHH
eukprot:g30695.t1